MPKRYISISLSLVIIFLSYFIGRTYFDVGVWWDGAPTYSPFFIVRSSFVFIAAILLFNFLASPLTSNKKAPAYSETSFPKLWILYICTTVGSAVLLVISPNWFSQLAQEDVFVETLSWYLNFGAAIILLWTILVIKNQEMPFKVLTLTFLGLGAGLLKLIGLEEVSWFQRTFNIQTPNSFSSNQQNETNIHNFATSYFETAYYLSVSILTLMLPIWLRFHPLPKWITPFEAFFPPLSLIPFGVIVSAYNFDMWDAPFTQWPFYTGLLCAFLLPRFSQMTPDLKTQLLQSGVAALVCQLIFLIFGYQMLREWDVTEYKEMLISFILVLYAWHVSKSLRNQPRDTSMA